MTSGQYCYPVLPYSSFIVWDGCKFLDPGYFAATNSVHPGADFNARTGGDTDLGLPVYSCASGRVIHCQYHDVWGWIVVTEHKSDGIEIQYAHFNEVKVKQGDIVLVGQQLGTIGRGGKNRAGKFYFYAHLHMEVRKVLGLKASEWPSRTMDRPRAEAYVRATRIDPEVWLAQKDAATSLEALRSAQAAASPVSKPGGPVAVPVQADGLPDNWYQVRNASDKTPIPGKWVSVWKDDGGKLVVYEVEPWKLAQKGIKA